MLPCGTRVGHRLWGVVGGPGALHHGVVEVLEVGAVCFNAETDAELT